MRSSPSTPLGERLPYNSSTVSALADRSGISRYGTRSDPTVAAIEGATYAPLFGKLPTGADETDGDAGDSFGSPIERIFIAENGSSDCANPQRQGLDAAITDGFRPNNTLGGIPTLALDYSPAWDINLYEWTPDAIEKGYRQQLREEFQILTYVAGWPADWAEWHAFR